MLTGSLLTKSTFGNRSFLFLESVVDALLKICDRTGPVFEVGFSTLRLLLKIVEPLAQLVVFGPYGHRHRRVEFRPCCTVLLCLLVDCIEVNGYQLWVCDREYGRRYQISRICSVMVLNHVFVLCC